MPQLEFKLWPFARLTFCPPLLALVSLTTFAHQGQQTDQSFALTLSEREGVARPLLLHAESDSTTFDPASRSLVLYRAAGAWLALDRSRAVRLYRESFAAAHDSPPLIRRYLEEAILNDLLPLSPIDVLGLLPAAVPSTKTRLYAALMNFSLLQGDYVAAVHVFEQAVSNGVLPLRSTVHLFASLPASASTDREDLFHAAIQFYDAHPDRESWHWTVADLVARFYKQLPRDQVLQAIHIVLSQAEQQDQHPPGMIGMGPPENNLTFHSNYDFQLFAVAPVLQQLDTPLAAKLLAQHDEAAASLERYPQGLVSFYGGDSYVDKDALRPDHVKPPGLQLYNAVEENQTLKSLDMGLEFTVPRNLTLLGVTGSLVSFANPDSPDALVLGTGTACPSDLTHNLELAKAVPAQRKVATMCNGPWERQWCSYENTFPQASVVQTVAERCTYSGESARARTALQKELELIEQIPAEDQIKYLATAADLYLRLGDRDAAALVVQKGFLAARTLYDLELVRPGLQGYPKGIWNSAEAYRRMTTLGVNSSLDATFKAIREIPDPVLQELEEVMIARALLGVPVRRNMTAGTGTFCTTETEVAYDQL